MAIKKTLNKFRTIWQWKTETESFYLGLSPRNVLISCSAR
jgi:hypothetical protein